MCDADSGQRMVLKMLLTKLGCTVKMLQSGADVVKTVKEGGAGSVDVVFVVTAMPDVSGWDVVEQIRALPSSQGLPIVAVRAASLSKPDFDAQNAAFKSGLSGGCDAFAASIQKPVDMQAVDAILTELCGAPQAAAPQAAAAAAAEGGSGDKTQSPSGGDRNKPQVLLREASKKKAALRILVVEDHWANQKLLEAMLKQRGHDVQCCENGLEAVNLTASVEFDLILMDCNMPVLDGFASTERIRARKALNGKVPIIAVTANAMKGDRDKCMASGMDDYITKPVQRVKLHEMIAKWTGIDAAVVPSSPTAAASAKPATSPS